MHGAKMKSFSKLSLFLDLQGCNGLPLGRVRNSLYGKQMQVISMTLRRGKNTTGKKDSVVTTVSIITIEHCASSAR